MQEVPAADVARRSAAGAMTTAAVGLLGRGAGLATTVLVTHFLSKAEYGHANLALIVATIANLASLLSPQQALLTRPEKDGRYEEAARLVHSWAVWSGALVACLLLAGGRPLVSALQQPEAAPLLYVYCGALVLERLGVTPTIDLRYHLRFGDVARLDLLGDACYVVVTVSGALLGAGPLCLPLGMVARHAARLLGLLRLLGERMLPRPSAILPHRMGPEQRGLVGELWRFSLPVHLGALGELATLYLDNVFAGALYQAAGQGLYAVGYTIVMTPADTIARYGANAMVRALAVPEAEARRRTFLLGLRYLCALLFPIGIGAGAVAGTLEAALLPPRWHGVAELVVGLSAGAMTLGCFQMAFSHLTAMNRPRLGGLLPTVRLGAFVLGLFLVTRFDPQHQHLSAVAWAVSAAFVLAAVFALWLCALADGLRIGQIAGALGPALLGSVSMGAGLWLLRRGLERAGLHPSPVRLVIEIIVGAGLYAAYLRLLHPALWREATGFLGGRMKRG